MNIVGEGLRPFVSQQIATRQEIYGSGGIKNRTLEEIEYLNSRTAFVKLVSSVNLKDNFNPASAELKAIKNKYGANKLAEAFILFNGTSNIDNIQRSGINREGNLINNTAAYGVGGLEFGLSPMPGIISATIKTETRGSLKTGIINIKAWNRAQFEIIDILYLRLGYGILLEWGNTIYFDNNKKLIKEQPNSIAKDFLIGTYNTQTVLDAINQKRKNSSGNYDAIFGKVVNFSWQFGDNGSYDITLTIRSIGDIVEGLKLNILVNDKAGEITIDKPSTNSSDSTPPSEPPQPTIESYRDKHQIGKLLYEVKRCLDKYSVKQNGCLSIGNIYLNNIGQLTEDIATERNFLVQTYAGNENQYYIRLGAFLNFLQEKIVPRYTHNGISIPQINFDYTTADNIIYAVAGEGTVSQVSTEPDKCVITTQIKYTDGNVYYYAPEGQPFKTNLGNVTVGQVMNIYLNFMYILSVIDEQATQDSSSKKIAKTITILNSLLNGASTAIGGANRLTTYIDEEENKIKIIDENPLHGKNEIIKALSGIPNDETITKLDLYGYYNNQTTAGFVRKFGFKTEITPELSYMLSIGAQAAGSVIGQDSTALSKLNEGLEDRIKPEVIDAVSNTATSETKDTKLAELNERYKNSYADFSKALKNLGSLNNGTIPIWDKENISNYSNLQLDFIAYNEAKTAIKEKKASNHIGFIPISLNLTLDGMSGIKIYNALRVDTAYLPSNYPATMDFIITGVSNKIENNTWTTDLTTVMVPRDPSQSNSPQDQDGNQSTQNSAATSTTNSAAASTATSSNNRAASRNTGPLTKTVTSGFPVKTTSFRVANVAKSQIVIHYSAGAPLADKGKSTVDFLMGRSHKKNGPPLGLSYHYIIDYNGFIENVIPDNYVAFHAGNANQNSIGISLLNYGVAYSENRATYKGTINIGEKGVLLVNENGKPQSYRNWNYACEISLAQQQSLERLLGIIADRYPKIKYSWKGKKTFDILFPPNGTSYNPNIPGIYTHCSVTTQKTDCMPTPRIMEVLKRVKLNGG